MVDFTGGREGGRGERENMHQVLLQVRQNSYRNIQAVAETNCHLSGRIHYLWPQEGQRYSSVKCLLIYFLVHGIVHHKFVPLVLTVNQHFYTDIL